MKNFKSYFAVLLSFAIFSFYVWLKSTGGVLCVCFQSEYPLVANITPWFLSLLITIWLVKFIKIKSKKEHWYYHLGYIVISLFVFVVMNIAVSFVGEYIFALLRPNAGINF